MKDEVAKMEETAPSDKAGASLRSLGIRMVPGSPFITYIQIKEHRGSVHAGAAMFVAGLPLGMSEELLQHAMLCFGEVTQVVLHPSKRSGMVLFGTTQARSAALQAAARAQIVDLTDYVAGLQGEEEQSQEPIGLKAWVTAHKALRPPANELQKQLDMWTDQFEAAEAEKERERQAAMAGDGWTVVVRSKGRKKSSDASGFATQSGGMALAAAQATADEQKKKKPVLQDFYRFQQRDRRRTDLMDLRHKFDQDRQRISELRATRNFKPF